MSREKKRFACQSCGAVTGKWSGRCETCGEWNTVSEEADVSTGIGGGPARRTAEGRRGKAILTPLDGNEPEPRRLISGINEYDRACGGGMVPGSALLAAGDPGIGKSTLLLQVMAALAGKGLPVVYVSGEEAAAQIRLRAGRLGLHKSGVPLAAETRLDDILAALEADPPAAAVIDSIQTMWSGSLESAPGSVTQVRNCSQALIQFAKRQGTTIILVGHVTKDGQIAGPRVIEHMVDAVLHFEGERGHPFRILRAVKNRYGPADEIGVFEMSGQGLREVANPSAMLLGERESPVSGTAVFAGIEGTRPVLVEVQALVSRTASGSPRRAVVGCDSARLAMILAVLDARCGLSLGDRDVHLNVAGGLRVTEPAADLAMAAALVSSVSGVPLPAESVVFGEVSLSGELRPVSRMGDRLKEAHKLGFKRAVLPSRQIITPPKGLTVSPLPHLQDLLLMLTQSPAASGEAGRAAAPSDAAQSGTTRKAPERADS